MRREPTSFQTGVRAFRELTAAPADGAATRARVLAGAAARVGVRRSWKRRLWLVVAALIGTSSLAAAAVGVTGRRWRAPRATAVSTEGEPAVKTAVHHARATRVIPPVVVDALVDTSADTSPDVPTEAPVPAAPDPGAEARAYARAHRAHFVADEPARALVDWNAYLARYPAGAFAPEARYNRALCLVRMGRVSEAIQALEPIADAPPGAYRRNEATTLLAWLRERDSRPQP